MILGVGNLSMQPRGSTNPARPGLAKQPEASLAWAGATLTAKRRQPVPRLCDRAPKSAPAGALVVDTCGGHVGAPQRPGAVGPTGAQEHGRVTFSVARSLEGPAVSTDISGSGTGTSTPRSPRPRAFGRGEGNEAGRDERQGFGAPHTSGTEKCVRDEWHKVKEVVQ